MSEKQPATVARPVSRPLGEYLGCDPETIHQALTLQHDAAGQGYRKRLGDILVEAGHISRSELLAGIHAQRHDRLAACPLFARLSDQELDELSYSFEDITVEPDGVFVTQDTPDNYLYILASGLVQVFRTDELDTEIPLSEVMPGEPIGEMAYFSDGLRSASARAVERASLVRIHYTELSRCLDTYPNLAIAFLQLVTRRLRRTNLAFEEHVHRRITAERSLRNLNEFLDLSEVLDLKLGIEGLIERVVHTASKLMEADRASLFLVDQTTGDLWSKVAEGDEVKEIRVPAGAGIAGWVAAHRETLNVHDAYEDPRFNAAVDRKTGYRTRTILCGPIFSLRGEIIGVVQVINKLRGVFNGQDEAMFRAFAHQAAISIENFNLYRKVVGSHEKMALLLDIATSLGETLELNKLIRDIVTRIPDLLQCDRSTLFMVDRDSRELWTMEAHGEGMKEIRFPLSVGIAGHSATTGEVVAIADVYQDPRFNPEVDRKTGYHTRNMLCVPLRNRDGQVVGVAQAINKDAGPFQQDDMDLLRAISSQMGVALENAQLYARTVSMKNFLENVQESISNGILTLDDEYQVITANSAALRMLGLRPDQLIGRDLRTTLGAGNPFLMELTDRVYQQGTNLVRYDVDIQTVKGESTTNVNIVPLTEADHDQHGLVLVLEDITREKRVHGTLTRYMPKDIVDQVLQDESYQGLGGVQSEATVLFNDIRGFTSLSEMLGATGTMDFLNQYFSLMVDEVFRHNGLLDKFIGDAMMAVFGVPYAQDDDPVRAVNAALCMKARLKDFNAHRAAAGLPRVRVGVGINTGEIISGNIGSEKRMDYTVIGDTVNIAARLESLNKQYGTQILISEPTRDHIGDAFTLIEVDRVMLMGKTRPTRIYEVVGDRSYELSALDHIFCDGLHAYQGRDFARAREIFSRGDGDLRCLAYGRRCERLVARPPREDWDGVWQALEK